MIASVGEVAMFFAISNFTTVNRAALFAARVAVGAAVRNGHGGIWGVSDPLCHPPITPGTGFRGSLTPQMHVAVVRQNRVSPVTLRSVVDHTCIDSIDENVPVRFSPETAFIEVNAHSHRIHA